MITFKLNGTPYNIPTKWEEVTLKQYTDLFELKDDTVQLVSIFTGLDAETLRNAVIIGLDDILTALSFINTPATFPGSVFQVGQYKIPVNDKGQFNIQHESLAQYEDMRSIMKKVPEGDFKAHTKAYVKYVAIYVQKIKDGSYQPLRVPAVEDELMNCSAFEVCTLGAFFFLKLWSYTTGTLPTSPNTLPNQKKSKPDLKSYKKPSALSRQSLKRRKN